MEHLKEIKSQKLLLVEGKDEEAFFKIFLKKKKIDGIEIISSGGKEQFQKLLPIIKKATGFDGVNSLAVIHDSDNDAQAAFQRICSILINNNLNSPQEVSSFVSGSPRVGVFIIPDGENTGKLESLCLSTVKSEGIIKCIDSFIACIEQESNSNSNGWKKPKDIHKARCRAFLSAMEKDTPNLGIAAEKGYWNFNSEKLNPLLNFLKQL